jgi:hypothetical protein
LLSIPEVFPSDSQLKEENPLEIRKISNMKEATDELEAVSER